MPGLTRQSICSPRATNCSYAARLSGLKEKGPRHDPTRPTAAYASSFGIALTPTFARVSTCTLPHAEAIAPQHRCSATFAHRRWITSAHCSTSHYSILGPLASYLHAEISVSKIISVTCINAKPLNRHARASRIFYRERRAKELTATLLIVRMAAFSGQTVSCYCGSKR